MWLKNLYPKLSHWVNYYYSFASVYHQPRKTVVQPGYWVDFKTSEKDFLTACAASFNNEIDYSRGYWQKETALCFITDVTFLGNTGALIKQNKVIKESVFDQLRLTKSPAFRSPAWMLAKKKTGRYTSIMHLPWAETSNYHWFLDCLPRLYALLTTVQEPTILIIPKKMPAFQRETLSFLIQNHSWLTLQPIAKNQKWHLPEFIFSTFISNHYSGFLPTEVLQFIRSGIWQGYGIKDNPVRSRIYISRSKANKRRLLNEDKIQALLKEHNFTTVYAEDLSYADQVQLFYNAKIVIGAHGAGLTNILFGRDLQVIELHPADMVRSHYFMICKALEFNYHYLLGSAGNLKQDFTVDPDLFRNLLNSLIWNSDSEK